MAVDKSSASTITDRDGTARKKKNVAGEKPHNEQGLAKPSSLEAIAAPRKRNSCPGVRVVGSRIYDSENGITCHQCRQKTRDFAAACKQIRKGKPCPIHFCHKCLLNRYGEKADEVSSVESWSCPRCRGVCNCSLCMKKKGHLPTGILIHAAKATGFSSVHELLDRSGADLLDAARGLKSMSALGCPAKRSLNKEDEHVRAEYERSIGVGAEGNGVMDATKEKKRARKKGKTEANCVNVIKPCGTDAKLIMEDVQGNEPLNILVESIENEDVLPDALRKIPIASTDEISEARPLSMVQKKVKRANAKKENPDDADQKKTSVQIKGKNAEVEHSGNLEEIKQVKKCTRGPAKHKRAKKDNPDDTDQKKTSVQVKGKNAEAEHSGNLKEIKQVKKRTKGPAKHRRAKEDDPDDTDQKKTSVQVKGKIAEAEHTGNIEEMKQAKNYTIDLARHKRLETVLPQGTPLTEIAGIQWAPQDVGSVLQFLEFCIVFSKVLDIKKGEPDYILRELAKGRVRRGTFSPIIKFHKKLLSFVEKEMGEEYHVCSTSSQDTWLLSPVNCINGPEVPSKKFSLDTEVYDSCDLSEKLKILNLLCDKTLDTNKLRNWISEENIKFVERNKDANETILAAKKKEKDLKQRLKDDFAKATLSVKDGTPFSDAEHHNHISQIKAEIDNAHAEMLELMKLLPKRKPRRDALRTEPLLLKGEGHVYWELEGHSDNVKVVKQEIEDWSSVSFEDKWFSYDQEGEKAIDKHISSIRKRKRKQLKYITEKQPEDVHRINELMDASLNQNGSAERMVA